MGRKEPKSKILVSICQDLETKSNDIVCLNASLSDLDWMIAQLQKERDILYDAIKSNTMPEHTWNKIFL